MNTKTVYQTDRAGIYVEEATARESPREPGRWLIPGGCVEVPPPTDVPEGLWPRWNGHDWELVTKPVPAAEPTAAQKLTAFLLANPDVAALVTPPTA